MEMPALSEASLKYKRKKNSPTQQTLGQLFPTLIKIPSAYSLNLQHIWANTELMSTSQNHAGSYCSNFMCRWTRDVGPYIIAFALLQLAGTHPSCLDSREWWLESPSASLLFCFLQNKNLINEDLVAVSHSEAVNDGLTVTAVYSPLGINCIK